VGGAECEVCDVARVLTFPLEEEVYSVLRSIAMAHGGGNMDYSVCLIQPSSIGSSCLQEGLVKMKKHSL
jgi:hypothetical protein